MSMRFQVGDLVRVLERSIPAALEHEAPELAAHQRWQMGRVFRVCQVSPTGHVGLAERDVEGNAPPIDQPTFLHPSLVELAGH